MVIARQSWHGRRGELKSRQSRWARLLIGAHRGDEVVDHARSNSNLISHSIYVGIPRGQWLCALHRRLLLEHEIQMLHAGEMTPRQTPNRATRGLTVAPKTPFAIDARPPPIVGSGAAPAAGGKRKSSCVLLFVVC